MNKNRQRPVFTLLLIQLCSVTLQNDSLHWFGASCELWLHGSSVPLGVVLFFSLMHLLSQKKLETNLSGLQSPSSLPNHKHMAVFRQELF